MKFPNSRRALVLVGCLLAASTLEVESKKQRTFSPKSLTFTQPKPLKHEKLMGNTVEENLKEFRGGAADNTLPNCLMGSIVCGLIEQGVKQFSHGFPSSLGGCIFLFIFLLLIEAINPLLANSIYEGLAPAAAFLAKWMAPLFVPGLVMLPLAAPVGGSVEVLKIIFTGVIGFVFTISTSGYAALAIRQAQGQLSSNADNSTKKKKGKNAKGSSKEAATSAKPKPFHPSSLAFFSSGAALSALVTLWASKKNNPYTTPIQTIFFTFTTMASYIWCANLPAAFTKVVHPLATSSILVLAIIYGFAMVTGQDFYDVLRTYKVGTLAPMKTGAGDILMFLLGAPVVSFAISVYSRRQLLFSNLPVVVTAMMVGSAGSMFATAGFVRLIALGAGESARLVRLSVLARNITTALAIAVTNLLGGDISIAASVVCLTGIVGGTYGRAFMDFLGIQDPISRGLAMGCSSQGLGVASISGEPDAFPFAAIAMVLTAIAATTLTTIPALKTALISVACGSIQQTMNTGTGPHVAHTGGNPEAVVKAVIDAAAETGQNSST